MATDSFFFCPGHLVSHMEMDFSSLESISRSKQYQQYYLLLCFSLAASFLIPYLICLVFCGIPIFYLEVALGQYVQQGVVGAWAAYCPALGGEIAIQSAQVKWLKWNFEVLLKFKRIMNSKLHFATLTNWLITTITTSFIYFRHSHFYVELYVELIFF